MENYTSLWLKIQNEHQPLIRVCLILSEDS